MYTKLTLIGFFVLLPMQLLAQGRYAGKVVANNQAVPGAVVQLTGSAVYVVTDANGNFQFQAEDGPAIVVVSYAGYEDQTEQLAQGLPVVIVLRTVHDIPVARHDRAEVYRRRALRAVQRNLRLIRKHPEPTP